MSPNIWQPNVNAGMTIVVYALLIRIGFGPNLMEIARWNAIRYLFASLILCWTWALPNSFASNITPRYFTSFLKGIALLLILIRNFLYLCLLVNIIATLLDGLIDNPYSSSHRRVLSNACCIRLVMIDTSMPFAKSTKSSLKSTVFIPGHWFSLAKSSSKRTHKRKERDKLASYLCVTFQKV